MTAFVTAIFPFWIFLELLIFFSSFIYPKYIFTTKTTNFTKYPTGFDEVAKYVKEHKKLPDNYINKDQAEALGWVNRDGNLHKAAPGKSIGGDIFENRKKQLPDAPGRTWYEADINYVSGYRGNDRIVYSSDGLVYKTSDHYKTFTEIK